MPRSPRTSHRSSPGHTLLELLVALALLAILLSWAWQSRPSSVAAASAALRSQVVQARHEAIERNEPVALVYNPELNEYLTVALGEVPAVTGCEAGEVLSRLELGEFRRVKVETPPGKGLVWLPNGTGRTCDGGGAFNQTIVLDDGRRQAKVIVSRAGRVRSELSL